MRLHYSKKFYARLTIDKKRDEVKTCIIESLEYFNRSPREIWFDNMAMVMVKDGKHKKVHNEIKQSEKDIAKRMDVSVSTIDCILNTIASHTVLRHPTLPKSMNWDEFKATKDIKGKMAFIITNNDNGNLFDINDSRKSIDLEKYFKRYGKKECDKVEHISMDFYSGYIFLAKRLFKNATISIDRFHIVVQAYNALNITRVGLCKKNNPNYNKLKSYWKLIVKNIILIKLFLDKIYIAYISMIFLIIKYFFTYQSFLNT